MKLSDIAAALDVRLENGALRPWPKGLIYVGVNATRRNIAHQVRSCAVERIDKQLGENPCTATWLTTGNASLESVIVTSM